MIVADGWLPIVSTFTELVAWDVEHNHMPHVSIDGVLEDSTELVLFYTGGDIQTDAYAKFATHLSRKICEECGLPATSKIGWPVRCDSHL